MASVGVEEEDRVEEKDEELQKKVVHHVYSLYYELMRDRSVSTSFAAVLVLTAFIQVVGFVYDKRADYPFDDEWYSSISSVVATFRVYPAIETTGSPTLYWIAQYSFFALLLFYVVLALYVGYHLSRGRRFFKAAVGVLQVLSSALYWVLFLPMVEGFVSVYSCDQGFHVVDTSVKCWTGVHVFYCVFFTFALLLAIVVVLAISVFYNESRADAKDGLKRLDTSLEIHIFFYRLVMGILAHFLSNKSYNWLLPLCNTFAIFYYVLLYWKQLNFYDPFVSTIYGIGICSYFWTSLNLLIMVILEGTGYTGQSITMVVGVVIIVPLVVNLRKWRVQQVLFGTQYDKIKNEYEFDIYIKKVLDLLENKNKSEVDELVLLGFMSNHKAECANSKCPLSQRGTLFFAGEECSIQDTTLSDPIVVLSLVASFYKVYAKVPSFKSILHISYSHFCFAYMKNIHLAVVELETARRMFPSFQELFTIYKGKRRIEEHLIERYSTKASSDAESRSFHNLDVTVVIKFENLLTKLYRAVEKSTNEHIEFWTQLDSLLPDLNVLHKLGLSITNCNRQNDEIWRQLYKINPNHSKTLNNYGSYLKDIQNNEETGSILLKRGKTLEAGPAEGDRTDFSIMFAEDTAIIVMSAGNKETQGKIVKTNAGITQLFNYNPLEVVGHDVNILMPKEIGDWHNQFLEDFFKTGKEKVINNEREFYAVRRGGDLICISTLVKLVPSLKDDIQYIGLIRQRYKESQFILTNAVGRIDSMSESLIGQLDVPQSFLRDNEVYVQFLFPDLATLEEGKDKTLRTLFDRLQGKFALTFILPRSFASIVQNYSKSLNMTAKEREQDLDKSRESIVNDPDEATAQKLPKSVMKIARFIYGGEFNEGEVKKTSNILKDAIDYELTDKRETWQIEIKELDYGDGKCRLKAFRILSGKETNEGDSEKYSDFKASLRKRFVREGEMLPQSKVECEEKLESRSSINVNEANEVKEERWETENFAIKPLPMDQPNEENEPSGYINDSMAEQAHLAASTSIIQDRLQKETYLQKQQEHYTDQEKVIKDLLKGHQPLKKPGDESEDKAKASQDECNSSEGEMSDEIGSIASGTKSLMKRIRVLRNAVYEEYCPSSVMQLIHVGRFVVLALLLISLLYFLITRELYSNLKENVANVKYMRDRLNYIIAMGGCTRTLMLLNPENGTITGVNREGEDYYLDGFEGKEIEGRSSMNYQEWTFYCVDQSSKGAKEAQNGISTGSYTFDKETQELINPSSVKVSYKEETQIEGHFSLDCWSAIISLIIHGLKVKDIALSQILPQNPSIYYIMENSFNNIMSAISLSMEYMEKETEKKVDNNVTTIMILLIVASASIAVSVLLILRVAIKVSNNKEAILKLFMDIPSKSVKEQLGKCRRYFGTLRDFDKMDFGEREAGIEDGDAERKDDRDNTQDEEDGRNKDETEHLVDGQERKSLAQAAKQKKYKPYSKNLLILLVQFSLFVVVFEGYFVIIFVRSSIFLADLMDLVSEFVITSSQSYSYSLLYQTFQECVGTHGSSHIEHVNSEEYLFRLMDKLVMDQEEFLKQHSENLNLGSGEYDELFDALMYGDICEHMFSSMRADCEKYTVLTRGLHSASIEHLYLVREFVVVYLASKSAPNQTNTISLMNDEKVASSERMVKRYFTRVYRRLLLEMKSGLNKKIDREGIVIMICFIVFAVFLLLYYVSLWTLFVESTRNSLWVTKCMLGIIPVKTILEVQNIKNFLVDSSKGLMLNLGSG